MTDAERPADVALVQPDAHNVPIGIAEPDARSPFGRWMHGLDNRTWRAVRRFLTVTALVPVFLVVAAKADHIVNDPILGAYGVAVIGGTVVLMYLAFARYRDPGDRVVVSLHAPPKVSFLLAVKNEVDNIAACVESILESSYPNIELIVVDDGSDDGTGEVLASIASRDELTVLTLPMSVGKKRALIEAVRVADGSVFAFTDSDCILAEDALERCVAVIVTDPGLGAVSGHARALNADKNTLTRTQDVWYDGQFSVAKAAEASVGSVSCVSGPLAVFRREAILNFFPAWANDRFAGQEFLFATDRQLTAYVLGQRWIGKKLKDKFREDPLVWAEPYRNRRWRVGYVHSARVLTNVPHTMRSFVRQQVRWKKSFIRNLFFNGRYFWRRGPGAASLYYGHTLWVLAAPFMAFRHLVWLPLHGEWGLVGLYLCGVATKGAIWAGAYKIQNPHSSRWVYRPLMSLISSIGLSWIIVYSAVTLRKSVWYRG